MSDIWSLHSAGSLVFGRGSVARLGELVAQRDIRRVFIITDKNLVQAGVVEPVRASLKKAQLSVGMFDGGQPEPAISTAETCVGKAEDFGADAVLGLGGGSNMDLAKVTAAVLKHDVTVHDFIGDSRIPGPVLPTICVPTTSGTGSEVTAASVLTDTENKMKVGILSNFLRPSLALVDPELTVSCPAKVTADSGIDALTHAIEAYTAIDNAAFPLPDGERTVYQGRHPIAMRYAEQAIELVGQHLVAAVREPGNMNAREGMALAATVAGLAFSNVGVALVHAMEYPVGGALHCSHGCGNGLLLPYVMRFNLPGRERDFARVARLLGADVSGLDEAAAAEEAVRAVERLKQEIGIPERLRELGAKEEHLNAFAEKAFAVKRILRVNPREVTLDAVKQIFQTAL